MAEKVQVFVQTAFLGDVLLSVPFLKNWNYLLDGKKILICRKGVGSLFKELELVDQVIEIEKSKSSTYDAALKQLSSFEVDTVICAHQSFRSTLFVRKIKAARKIGYKNFYSFLAYDESIDRDLSLPEPIRLLQLLTTVDPSLQGLIIDYRYNQYPYEYKKGESLKSPPNWASSDLRLKVQEKRPFEKVAEALNLDLKQKRVALFPGSVWETKKWTEAGYRSLCSLLIARGYQIVLMGGPDEFTLCELIREGQEASIVNLAGKTSLLDSVSLISNCDGVVSNDSAGAHLASLVDKKIVTVFGPTVLDFGYRPWSTSTYIAENKDLFCRPCGPHGHKKCPLGTHECMKSVSAKEVEELTRFF